jgi:cytidylate kinase
MARLVITIDGPAASGKSTIARLLAERLNAVYLDTGAMYRAAALAAMRAGVDLTSQYQLLDILNNVDFEFASSKSGMRVQIDGADVTEQIRDPRVTANVRYIAGSPPARQCLVAMQRKFAEAHGRVVTEGRDQGTVAFPDADVKFYLTADIYERTRRRHAEMKTKGFEQSFEEVRETVQRRDKSDQSRSVGPLKPAQNAIVVDTTSLGPEEVVEKLLACVKEECSKKR